VYPISSEVNARVEYFPPIVIRIFCYGNMALVLVEREPEYFLRVEFCFIEYLFELFNVTGNDDDVIHVTCVAGCTTFVAQVMVKCIPDHVCQKLAGERPDRKALLVAVDDGIPEPERPLVAYHPSHEAFEHHMADGVEVFMEVHAQVVDGFSFWLLADVVLYALACGKHPFALSACEV
jgi:hypothetical protein